ncbi:MAG: winged helix-turn-helix transcriptional regulator [Sphingobacteriaceae bacterium]|nr:winged helix-turn-helix transcriptional regulator [Sphingobacteriaceae bacterium]
MVSLLFSNPNKIFSKDEIATEIWHNKDISSKRTIDIHIRNIRRALGDDIIKTYRGIGYCLKQGPSA